MTWPTLSPFTYISLTKSEGLNNISANSRVASNMIHSLWRIFLTNQHLFNTAPIVKRKKRDKLLCGTKIVFDDDYFLLQNPIDCLRYP